MRTRFSLLHQATDGSTVTATEGFLSPTTTTTTRPTTTTRMAHTLSPFVQNMLNKFKAKNGASSSIELRPNSPRSVDASDEHDSDVDFIDDAVVEYNSNGTNDADAGNTCIPVNANNGKAIAPQPHVDGNGSCGEDGGL